MIRRGESREDLARCVAICNAVTPDDAVVLEQLLDADGTFLLHEGGGYAYVTRSSVPGSAYAMVRVRPEARRRGIGSALLARAREQALATGSKALWGRVAETDAESLAFVRNRGFDELSREVSVVRELREGDGAAARASGIAELREEHLRGAYRVCVECVPEIHVPQRAEAPPYEDWIDREARQSPAAFVALDGGEVVGYARLYATGRPDRLENGLTAVLRSHRRRGIATALKRAEFAWAAERGYREVVTETAAGNDAMRAVNERLGYTSLPAAVIVSGSVS